MEGGSVDIDGKYHPAGSVITLARGVHNVAGRRSVSVTLRWGDHLARPAFAWPSGPVFTEY